MDWSQPKFRITVLSVIAVLAGAALWFTGGLSPSQPDLPPVAENRQITVHFTGIPEDCDACAFGIGMPVMGLDPVGGIALQPSTGELKVTLREEMDVPNKVFHEVARLAEVPEGSVQVARVERNFESQYKAYDRSEATEDSADNRATIEGSTISGGGGN